MTNYYDKMTCPSCKGDGIERKYRIIYECQIISLNRNKKNINYFKCHVCNGEGMIYWIDKIIKQPYINMDSQKILFEIFETCKWILYNKPKKDKWGTVINPYITNESIKKMKELVSNLLEDEIISNINFLRSLYNNINEYEIKNNQ